MSTRQDATVWRQLTESAIGRFGGAAIEITTRATADSRIVGTAKRARTAWARLAAPIKHRVAGTVTLAAAVTHVAMMLPQHPPGAWWLIVPSLAGAFGLVLIGLSFLTPRAGAAD